MKKILCLILCVVLSLTVLVGCSKGEIGDYIHKYEDNKQTEIKLTLNMYIVVGEGTTENAKTTIKQIINQHTTSTYNTSVVLNFVNADEYESTVNSALSLTGNNAPHIILITNKAMLDGLVAANQVVDLVPYLGQKAYQKLNTQIASSLLTSARDEGGKLYALPNSHIVGGDTGYKYLVYDLDVVEKMLWYGRDEIAQYNSLEDASELIGEINALVESGAIPAYTSENIAGVTDYVCEVRGPYELKEQLEAANKFCQIVEYPTATAEDAFAGAFAIVNNENNIYEERAMRILHAINADSELRNTLQYGVMGTNYHLDSNGNVVRVSEGNNVYHMDLRYTGDVFKALYCEELGWTKEAFDNGVKQNSQSVSAK